MNTGNENKRSEMLETPSVITIVELEMKDHCNIST